MTEEELYQQFLEDKKNEELYSQFEAEKANKSAINEEVYDPNFIPGMPERASKDLMYGIGAGIDVLESPLRQGISESTKTYRESAPENPDLYDKASEYLPVLPTARKLKAVGSGISAVAGQALKNIRSPLEGPASVPSLSEIIQREAAYSPTIQKNVSPGAQEVGANVLGFTGEMAMPSVAVGALSKVPKTKKTLDSFLKYSREGLKAAERRQFAKVLSDLETKTQFSKTGMNIDPTPTRISKP